MTRRLQVVALIAFLAGLAGVFVGRAISPAPPPNETEVHALLHGGLDLTPAQQSRIEVIEARFAGRRRELESEMRASNAALAAAIEREHGYGPAVTAAVRETHHVMGTMQSETLRHLFEMRAVLDAEQTREFDATVMRALTTPPPAD